MEKTITAPARDCSNCKHRGIQQFPDGPKIVCVKNPPQIFVQFGQVPKGAIAFVAETLYPVPPIPCSQFEESPPR